MGHYFANPVPENGAKSRSVRDNFQAFNLDTEDDSRITDKTYAKVHHLQKSQFSD